ncbi:MAG: Rne/Rng family ribonuclease, partial [Nitrosomonadales bacterium]|nr:Rne/Rng family ribonuclease [Nitrosomonadales bacterium]
RRIEGEDRNELRDTMAQLEVPNGMSIIARTAGIGRNLEELQWDMNYLLQLWTAIEGASTIQTGAFLIYQEGSLVIRAIRDYFQPDIGEILIDTPDIHEQAVQFMNHVMPGNVARVKLYQDEIPLFSRFQIEHQIETAFSREVRLPSGGAIVIDHTEALVSIDVNSGRSTKGTDIEQTAFNTNLEAAEEVARQLRLRDLGGLVVIDFIDMESQRNQREVENRLRDALHYDRARVQTGKISRFGLLELSRQRLRPSLGESNHIPCPRCHGTGHIRGIESTALHILRITQEEAMKENSAIIQVQLPVEAATFLLNEKRADIHKIEQRMGVEVVLIPNIHMETPNYTITRVRSDDVTEENSRASYEMVELPSEEEILSVGNEPKLVKAEAAVKGITPASPAPASRTPEAQIEKTPGLISRLIGWLGMGEKKEISTAESTQRREASRGNRNNRNRNRSSRNADRAPGDRPQGNVGNQQERNAAASGTERNNRQPQRQNQQPNRNERNDRPQVDRPQNEQKPALATAPVEGNSEQRSRRGRNGRRDRGPRNENAQRDSNQPQGQVADNVGNVASSEVKDDSKTFMTAQIMEVVSTNPIVDKTPSEAAVTQQPATESNIETSKVEKVKAEPKAEKPAKEEKA